MSIEPTLADYRAVKKRWTGDPDTIKNRLHEIARAEAGLRLFREAHGRDATIEELGPWFQRLERDQ